MNRRDVLCLISSLPLSKLLPTALFDHALTKPASAADKVYRSDLVLDCNSAPPWEQGRLPLRVSDLHMVRDCGANIIKLTLGGINEDFTETVKEIGYVHQMIEVHPEYFLQVRVSADMQRAKREGKLGMILSFESVDMLEGKLEPLEIFRNLGIRVMQLSYNRKSPFGAGVMEGEGGGLTALGKEAVKRMNSLGITIDLSHANPQTTADVLNASLKAAIMSHAGWWSRISRIFRMSVRHWPPELMGWPTFGGKEALPRMLHDSSSRNTCLWFLRSRHQMDSSEVLVQSWPPIHD